MTSVRKSNQRFLVIFLFMTAVLYVSVALYYAVIGPEFPLAKLLVFTNIAIVSIVVVNDFTENRFDFFNVKIIFLVYYSLQFIIWPIMVLWVGVTRRPIPIDGYYTLGLFYSTLGILFFLLGNSLASKVGLNKNKYLLSDKWDSTLIWALVFGLVIVGYFAFSKLMQATGGISNYISLSGYYRSGGLRGLGHWVYLSSTILALPLLFYAAAYLKHPHGVPVLNLFVLVGMLFLCLFPAIVIGYRTAVLFPLVQVLLIYNYSQEKLSKRVIALSFLIIVCFLLLIGFWRQQTSIKDLNFLAVVGLELLDIASRFNASEVVAIMVKKLEETGDFAFGIPSLIGFSTILIPRAIYSDKIESMSERFTREIMADWFPAGIDPSGVAPSMLGEMYWNFSLIGVTFVMAIFGFICGVVYKFTMLHKDNRSILISYSLFYTYVFFAAEAPTIATNGFIPIIVATTVCVVFLNRGTIFSK